MVLKRRAEQERYRHIDEKNEFNAIWALLKFGAEVNNVDVVGSKGRIFLMIDIDK